MSSFALDGLTPGTIARPVDAAEAGRILAEAHAAGRAVVPWGGGSHQAGGNPLARYDLALDLRGLAGVVDHQPADLTLTVRAGTPLAVVQAALAAHGQLLPLEAEDPATATIGGLVSAGVSGPSRLAYGTARDFTIWTAALQADGTAVHGGAKVVKNVAGYDMTKLYMGSLGSAGVLTELCFKLRPLPATRPVVIAGFEEPGAAADALAELATGRLVPSLVTIVHGPDAWGEPYNLAKWLLVIGADGPRETTSWQVERFFGLASAQAALITSLDGEEALAVRQALMTPRSQGEVRLDLRVLPGQTALLLEALAFMPEGPPTGVFAEATLGVVRCTWATASDAWRAAATFADDLGGRWTLAAAPLALRREVDVFGPARPDRALMRRLKATLDPKGILAPGRFAGG
ncbi:MAG: linked oxidase domain protein [Cyanobacteria bacterium RYN_339]|nr:linked oxidase domain protein [Cyanobacteria bacterium RYN_339]